MPGPYLTPGVYIEEIPSGSRPIQGVSTSIAAFLGVTVDCREDRIGRPLLVTSWDQYTEYFGGYPKEGFLPLPASVRGFFENGGGVCYVASLMALNNQAPPRPGPAVRPTLQLASRGAGGAPSLELESKVGDPVTVTVADASEPGDDLFKVVVRAGDQEETYDNVTLKGGRDGRNVVQVMSASRLVTAREVRNNAPLPERRPVVGTQTIPVPIAPVATPVRDMVELAQGNLDDRVGLDGLQAIPEITMVCMPDIMHLQKEGKITMKDAIGLQNALIAHCEQMKDRIAILDAPYGLKVQQVKEWRKTEANFSSKFAALYYPWITIQNPTGKGGQISVPPSGYVAGIYARVDSERGVHKAPANEVVRLAIDLELNVTDREQEQLNPISVNCIRSFPGRGIRVWGARTLDEPSSEWRYINVRRLFNYIEESIYEGTQWVVFEPNDMDLWERVKRTVSAFLTGLWRAGMLFGATPEEAFYVRCDAALNPPSARDRGELTVEVGIAPVKPAEFVIFRFKQIPGGGEISE